MNLNIKAALETTYDAIVVGSGISGGWAAKELSEGGLQTLVLERGRNITHIKDYPTMNSAPWELPNGNRPSAETLAESPKQARSGYVLNPASRHFFVNDADHPYEETRGRFDWIRGYHLGGRSITWGRQSYRWSDTDFEANANDGIAVDWPVRYQDIAPWYEHVEKAIGISGKKEGLAILPDSIFQKPMELNCVEKHIRSQVMKKMGRV